MTELHQYPFEFAKTRVQLRSEKGVPVPRNPFMVVANVFREEGARALYRGCSSLIVVGAEVSYCSCSMRFFMSSSTSRGFHPQNNYNSVMW